ncbi:MAG: hypothetical protein P1Q69_19570, partial [Candidatus Thorarchaeota archaeon]|nr:hypothetical protein [Candidatus Thorarchaeota archaeon]
MLKIRVPTERIGAISAQYIIEYCYMIGTTVDLLETSRVRLILTALEVFIIALNWTTGAYVDLLSVIIITTQLIVMSFYYSKEKHRHVVFLLGVYVSLTVASSLRFFATVNLNAFVMIVGYYTIPIVGVFTC